MTMCIEIRSTNDYDIEACRQNAYHNRKTINSDRNCFVCQNNDLFCKFRRRNPLFITISTQIAILTIIVFL